MTVSTTLVLPILLHQFLNKKVTLPSIELHEIKEDVNDYFKLDVKTDACPYYTAKW